MLKEQIECLRLHAKRAIAAYTDLTKRVDNPKYPDWADVALELCVAFEEKDVAEAVNAARQPFNLKTFMCGMPAVTGDGRKATFVTLHDAAKRLPLAVHIEGSEVLMALTRDGEYQCKGGDVPFLFMQPCPPVWVCICTPDQFGAPRRVHINNHQFDSKAEAIAWGQGLQGFIRAVRIDIDV